MKILSQYLQHLENYRYDGIFDPEISGIADDSRQVKPGYIFCAITGEVVDGHQFIPQAVKAGAVAVVCSDETCDVPENIAKIVVPDAYAANALLWECFYDFPGRNLNIVAITGTNGKTTTAFMLRGILTKAGFKCGLISTVKYDLGRGIVDAERTTPMPGDLHCMLREAADSGCTHVIMEASSHGLVQHRLGKTLVKTAVFTNLSGDHLDYHKTMEEYYQAKKLLFTEYLDGTMVINADDEAGQRLISEFPQRKCLKFGGGPIVGCRIIDFTTERDRTLWTLDMAGRYYTGELSLIGAHNVANFAAAAAAALSLEVAPELIATALDSAFRVPGRLEKFILPNGAVAFVDYAHTDDALRNVLQVLRKLTQGKIFTVFGCGGDRDHTKRPRMAQAAAEYSDIVVVTSDNPRTESPEAIIADILPGIPPETEVIVNADREQAIITALEAANPEDIILIAGKGHETYQEINGVKHDFDDREIVRKRTNTDRHGQTRAL
jgi:UDP-N-acetylmuramoyl-L-alanyl-D-glutamate--2,6-diaminopimelate ligase